MTKYKHIIFDLDGTIIESSNGILEGFTMALEQNNIKPIVPINSSLIGPPLKQTISNLVGTQDVVLIDKIADSFKAYYDEFGYKLTVMFDGIFEALEELSGRESKLYIATNKRIAPTLKIVEHLRIDSFFDGIYALDSFKPALRNKSQMLSSVVSLGDVSTDNAVYIGDRLEDGYASDENNLDFFLAVWGFGEMLDKDLLNKSWKLLKAPSDMLEVL